MQQHTPHPALEQQELAAQEQQTHEQQEQIEQEDAAGLSLEEEHLMLGEAAAADHSAEQDLAESERILAVSDALEDLAVIASEIKHASPVETALIDNAAQMAVAGTDVQPEELVPAMEALGGAVDIDKIKATAKRIWERILQFLKNVWEKIERFVYNTIGTIPAQRRRLQELKNAHQAALGGSPTAEKIHLNTGAEALSINGKPVANEQELLAGLVELTHAAEYVFGQYAQVLQARGEALCKAIDGFFDHADPGDAAREVREAIHNHQPPAPAGGSGALNKTRYPGFVTTEGNALLGNRQLVSKKFLDPNNVALTSLERARESGVELVAVVDSGEITREYTIPQLSAPVVEKILDQMGQLLTVTERFNRNGEFKQLLKTREDLKRASDAASKKLQGLSTAGDGSVPGAYSDMQMALFKASLNFNTAYARWTKNPPAAMVSHVLTTINATSMVVRKYLASIQTEGGKKEEKKPAAAKP